MPEIGKFDVEICVMPNGLEKYMAFTVNRNFAFFDSMQFKNSSLDELVINLINSDNDSKYLSREFSVVIATSHTRGELLELAQQNGVYQYEYVNSFKRFFDNRLPDRCEFYSSLEDESVSEKVCLHSVNV